MSDSWRTMPHDPWTRWFAGIAATLLAVLLILVALAAIRGPSTAERLTRVEGQVEVITCLLLIPIEERLERGLLECQPVSPLGGP